MAGRGQEASGGEKRETRAGDHQGGGLDGPFFCFDSLRELIGLLVGLAFRSEARLLHTP
jgi:hypothetical protein